MSRTTAGLTLGLVVVSAVMWLGCNQKQETDSADVDNVEESSTAKSESDEVSAELAKLSDEDRQLVVAQKVCPVSGKALGSMGPPIKVTVDGRHLFICCAGCEDKAKANFDDYYAKLNKASPGAATN